MTVVDGLTSFTPGNTV